MSGTWGFLEGDPSDPMGCVGSVELGQAMSPLVPQGGLVIEDTGHGGSDIVAVGNQDSPMVLGNQTGVAFLLAGDGLVEEKGTLGGNGFVNGGTAGFGDDQVMGPQ